MPGRPSRWTLVPGAQEDSQSILITCNDVTEKKKLEEQYLRAQRMESVGTLASGIAHDLNNVLTPITLGVETLATMPMDAEAAEMLAMMQEGARRGADTIKQLLLFARGTAPQRGLMQPRHLIRELVRLLQQTFPKNIQIYSGFSRNPWNVLADPSQLHQVLMNLCVNARDAMPQGGILSLTLENKTLDANAALVHPKARPADYVVFKVSDSGSGISPEIIERIFDPFFTTKPQGKGTGLGLSTVLGIVEHHEGFVLVQSQPKQGTTFEVYLPACAQADPTRGIEAAPAPHSGNGELILIVDDEAAIVRMAESILRGHGYTTISTTSSSEAVQLYERQHDRIKAVFTDVMMPFGDGRQLVTILYSLNPKLPMIVMSGLNTRELQQEMKHRGARVFLGKPFTSEELLAAIGKALQPGDAAPTAATIV